MTAQEVGKRRAILRGGLLKTAGWLEFAPSAISLRFLQD